LFLNFGEKLSFNLRGKPPIPVRPGCQYPREVLREELSQQMSDDEFPLVGLPYRLKP
jgi:hypothetical protein